ncbi:MAG: 5-formyltetrahydrofolate cyclo-ligase, partial [Arenicellales bacterium]|nr:5-formyltetrahydrofolate cyclo-ligase [Arenicellales bacterium]
EIDVTLVIPDAKSKSFYLPILPPRGQRRLWFGLYEPDTRLIPDRFGIPEPVNTKRIRAESLDLVLVPLVAFDYSGGRIGMGGGYYDATLSFVKRRGRARSVTIIGAAYQFQNVDYIPKDYWDIPLSGVITDQRFIRIGFS